MEMENRSGYYQEKRRGRRRYRPFYPYDLTTLKDGIVLDFEMMKMISDASFGLGTLDGARVSGSRLVGIMNLMSLCEGISSLKLEGLNISLESYLVSQLHHRKSEEEELLDRLMDEFKCIDKDSLTIKGLNKVANNITKTDVKVRSEQTFIRYQGKDPFAPCIPASINEVLVGYENYLASQGEFDELMKAAMLQYEIFTIQPFDAINGILQRYASLAYLKQVKRIKNVNLSLSEYFCEHKKEYENALAIVSEKGDFESYIKFFLKAVNTVSEKNVQILLDYDQMLQRHMGKVSESDCSDTIQAKLVKLLAYIQEHPVVEVKTTAKDLSLSFNTAANLIQILCEIGLLERKDDRNRNRYFLYREMLELVL